MVGSLEFWSVARAKAEYSTPFENTILFSLHFRYELCFCVGWFVRVDASGWVRIIPSNTPLNCTKDSRIDYVRSIYLCFYSCCSFYWVLFQSSKSVTYILCFAFTLTFSTALLFRISEWINRPNRKKTRTFIRPLWVSGRQYTKLQCVYAVHFMNEIFTCLCIVLSLLLSSLPPTQYSYCINIVSIAVFIQKQRTVTQEINIF